MRAFRASRVAAASASSSSSSSSSSSFRSLVEQLKTRGRTLTVCEQTTGGLINAKIMAVEGSSAVYWGGTVSYNTKKGLPFLMNDAQLQRRLLDNPLTRGTWESEAELYVRTKLQATAEIATAFLEAAGTDYAIAEGGAAGPTFRQEGLTSGFSALTIARWGRDGAAEIASQALVNSKTADREGNMELFAASAAEELLRVMDEEDEEASGSFIFYPPDPVPSPVIRISPSSFPTVGGATTTTAERPAEGVARSLRAAERRRGGGGGAQGLGGRSLRCRRRRRR
jgi:nicotinamide-nucleotide amidase